MHYELQVAIDTAARGQVTLMHGCGPLEAGDRLNPSCAHGDCINEFNFTFAAYLCAVGNHSYFSYARNADDGSAMGQGAWELRSYGLKWWPQYDMPLGAPLGPAKRDWLNPETNQIDPDVYRRTFATGTVVWVNLRTRTGIIHPIGPPL